MRRTASTGADDPRSARARLAARLALAVGSRGAVWLDCLALPEVPGVITVSRPPLLEPSVRLEGLQLVVVPASATAPLDGLAAANVPEVWLHDLEQGVLTALSRAHAGRFRRRSLILPGERVRLVALPDVSLVPLGAA